MSLACRTHGHPGCVGLEQDDCEIVTVESCFDDRRDLAWFTAGQILSAATLESTRTWLPLLDENELAVQLDRIRAIGGDLREAAGPNGADQWRLAQ